MHVSVSSKAHCRLWTSIKYLELLLPSSTSAMYCFGESLQSFPISESYLQFSQGHEAWKYILLTFIRSIFQLYHNLKTKRLMKERTSNNNIVFSRPKKVPSFRASRDSPTRFILQECSYVPSTTDSSLGEHIQSFHCDRIDFERNGNVKFCWSIWIHISIAEELSTRTVDWSEIQTTMKWALLYLEYILSTQLPYQLVIGEASQHCDPPLLTMLFSIQSHAKSLLIWG